MKIRRRKYLVLGCGPAGLFAAHALYENGRTFEIVSRKRRSEMFGAQYLHRPIEGLTRRAPILLEYKLLGTAEGYREKVYGAYSNVKVSPETLDQSHEAWDIREAYYSAWDLYVDHINNVPGITARDVELWISEGWRIVSSIPAPALCVMPGQHRFEVQEAWAIGDAPERGIFCPTNTDAGTVVCNGNQWPAWYRAANVFNYKTAEWPQQYKPPYDGVTLIQKPLRTNCDCFPQVTRVGRYGTWTKGVLSHEAYEKARDLK